MMCQEDAHDGATIAPFLPLQQQFETRNNVDTTHPPYVAGHDPYLEASGKSGGGFRPFRAGRVKAPIRDFQCNSFFR